MSNPLPSMSASVTPGSLLGLLAEPGPPMITTRSTSSARSAAAKSTCSRFLAVLPSGTRWTGRPGRRPRRPASRCWRRPRWRRRRPPVRAPATRTRPVCVTASPQSTLTESKEKLMEGERLLSPLASFPTTSSLPPPLAGGSRGERQGVTPGVRGRPPAKRWRSLICSTETSLKPAAASCASTSSSR